MSVVEALHGWLQPASCLACGVPAAWPCCARCLPSEPGQVGPWRLAADPAVTLWALGPYRDGLREAVLAGKLGGRPAALTELGRRLGTALAAAGIGADLVTWVAGRSAGRPRDHAERIGAGVAAALGLPAVGLWPRPAAATWAAPAGPSGPTGRRRRAHHPGPGAGWPAAASCWSTTWPPPAAPWAAPPPPYARPEPAGSRPPSSPPPAPPSPESGPPRSRRLGPGRNRERDRERVALCGCDPFPCVESGQYDQRAVKEASPHAEVIWQAGHASRSGCRARWGV